MRNNFIKTEFVAEYSSWIIGVSALLVFSPAMFLNLWLIDDHEIALLLTSFHNGGFSTFLDQWIQLPDFGTAPRFRPVYYALRAIEILVWQDHATLWLATRMAISFIFALSIFKLMSKIIPILPAIIVSLATLGAPWLRDTLFRLGPSEAYAVLFTALLIIALIPKDADIRWLSVAACIAMLVGIKENFLIIIPLAMYAVFCLMRDGKMLKALLAFFCVIFSLTCMAVLAYKIHLSSGLDIYSQNIGSDRFSVMLNSIFLSPQGWLTLALLGVPIFVVISEKLVVREIATVVVICACVAVLTFNLYFYSGVPAIQIHYAFPYWIIVLCMFSWGCARLGYKSEKLRSLAIKNGVILFVIAAMLTFMAANMWRGYKYALITINVDRAITEIFQKSKSIDEVVIVATSTGQYEAVISMARFMAFKKLSKPLFLDVSNAQGMSGINADLSDTLMLNLVDIGLKGGSGYQAGTNRKRDPNLCLEVVFESSTPSFCNSRVLMQYELVFNKIRGFL